MSYYCTFGDLQNELRDYYRRTGDRIQFIEAVDNLYRKGALVTEIPAGSNRYIAGAAQLEDFEKLVDKMYFSVTPSSVLSTDVSEEEMIPLLNDGFIIRHPRYTRPYLHRHNYVEMDYVVSGSCTFYFEEEAHNLVSGDLCIISPSSLHDIEIRDESTVYCIMLRKSTFQSAFYSLLENDSLLSSFFLRMLVDDSKPNYIGFHSEDPGFMRAMAQSLMSECHAPDQYSNSCCISLTIMMLANLLRANDGYPKVYHYHQDTPDFTGILSYIRRNHRTITLSELAAHFHYSKPHLCTIIKQNTGVSFTTLIREFRMSEARTYLTLTDLPVSDIADKVGYNSADNFSRAFRKSCGQSPVEYRRLHKGDREGFVPFRME